MAGLDDLSEQELEQMLAAKQQEASSGLAQTAGNMAISASEGLAAGLQKASTAPGLLLRDFTDAIGITDPKVSQAQRESNQALSDRATRDAAALGAPVTGQVAQIAGEAAPAFALGGSLFGAGKALLGAGRVADVGASAASSGLISGLQDTGGDLSARAENAGIGALTGAALSGVTNAIGGAITSRTGGMPIIDKTKEEAFRAAGIKPRPSQLIDSALSPKSKSFWEGVESDLNRIPLFGIRGQVKNAADKQQQLISSAIDEIDGVVPNVDITKGMFGTTLNTIDSSKAYSLNNIQRTVKSELGALTSNPGLKLNPEVTGYIQQLQNVKNLNFQQLLKTRQGIDDSINSLKKNLSNVASREEFAALSRIRGSTTNALDAIARKEGRLREWKALNKTYQDAKFIQGIKEARDKATNAGGEVFSVKQFNRALEDNMNFLQKDLRLDIPPQAKTQIMNLKKLSDLFASDKVIPAKAGIGGNLLSVPTGAVAGALSAATAAAGPVGFASAGALIKGLSLLATSRAGMNFIGKIGKITPNNPKIRQLAAVATALSLAEDSRNQEQTKRTTLDNMSEEELLQLLQTKQGAQQ